MELAAGAVTSYEECCCIRPHLAAALAPASGLAPGMGAVHDGCDTVCLLLRSLPRPRQLAVSPPREKPNEQTTRHLHYHTLYSRAATVSTPASTSATATATSSHAAANHAPTYFSCSTLGCEKHCKIHHFQYTIPRF